MHTRRSQLRATHGRLTFPWRVMTMPPFMRAAVRGRFCTRIGACKGHEQPTVPLTAQMLPGRGSCSCSRPAYCLPARSNEARKGASEANGSSCYRLHDASAVQHTTPRRPHDEAAEELLQARCAALSRPRPARRPGAPAANRGQLRRVGRRACRLATPHGLVPRSQPERGLLRQR